MGARSRFSATPLSSSASARQAAATHSSGAAAPLRLLYHAPGQWIEPGEQMKVSGIDCERTRSTRWRRVPRTARDGCSPRARPRRAGAFWPPSPAEQGGAERRPWRHLRLLRWQHVEPYQTDLTFILSVGARATVHQGTKIPFTGGSGCRPGSIVQAVLGDQAEGYRVIGQSTARAPEPSPSRPASRR